MDVPKAYMSPLLSLLPVSFSRQFEKSLHFQISNGVLSNHSIEMTLSSVKPSEVDTQQQPHLVSVTSYGIAHTMTLSNDLYARHM